MRRAFGLTIGAMFERQLRYWLASQAPERRKEIDSTFLTKLTPLIGQLGAITLEEAGVAEDIHELWLVANVVRHGDGPSLETLMPVAPTLWQHLPRHQLEAGCIGLASEMRIKDLDLKRYTLAVMNFWAAAGASSVPWF
jgi:hypothetical protein